MKIKELIKVIPNIKQNDGLYNPAIMIWVATGKNEDGTLNGIDWQSFYSNNLKECEDFYSNDFFNLPVAQVRESHEGTYPCIDIFISEENAKSIIFKHSKK